MQQDVQQAADDVQQIMYLVQQAVLQATDDGHANDGLGAIGDLVQRWSADR